VRTTLSRDALAPLLSRANGLVTGRVVIPVLGCTRVSTGPDGTAIEATDLISWFWAKVDAEPREPWSGCVGASRLQAFVQSLPAATIELSAGDSRLTVTGPGATARFGVLPSDDFPVMRLPAEPTASFELEPPALRAGLTFVADCAAHEGGSRPHLIGAFIDPSGWLVTTDGHRMAVYRLPSPLAAFEGVILPLPALRLLSVLLRGFSDNAVTVAVSPRAISFRSGPWSLVTKVIDGTFSDWRRVVPERVARPLVIEADALRRAVARAAAVCHSTRTRGGRLRLDGAELAISAATDPADTEVESLIPVEGGPGHAELSLKLEYLADALDAVGGERVELHTDGPSHPVWLCAAGEAESGIVIMPMRI
jgi:DNA polymerase-3 subunit beta